MKEQVQITIESIKEVGSLLIFNKKYKASKDKAQGIGSWQKGESYLIELTSEPDPQYGQVWFQPAKQQPPKESSSPSVSAPAGVVSSSATTKLECYKLALAFREGRSEEDIAKIASFIYQWAHE